MDSKGETVIIAFLFAGLVKILIVYPVLKMQQYVLLVLFLMG